MTTTFDAIETLPCKLNTVPAQINPGGPVPAWFADELSEDGATVTVAGQPNAAGCSTRVLPLPPLAQGQTAQAFTFSFNACLDANSDRYSQDHETDLMITLPDGTLINMSCQASAKTGNWQIGNWTDTGIPHGLKSGKVNPVQYVAKVDHAAKALTWVSINGVPVNPTIATIAGTPGAAAGWGAPNLIGVQFQETVGAVAGSYTCTRSGVKLVIE